METDMRHIFNGTSPNNVHTHIDVCKGRYDELFFIVSGAMGTGCLLVAFCFFLCRDMMKFLGHEK